MNKPVSVVERLMSKLRKLGFTERKAKVVAKGLVPVVMAVVKAKSAAPKPEKPRGLPLTLEEDVVPVEGRKGVDLLGVMNGLTSTRSYRVAAVKGEHGIVAVRHYGTDFGADYGYNVKFYPTLAYWELTLDHLTDDMGVDGNQFLSRNWYERVHCNEDSLQRILTTLEQMAKPKSRMKALVDRFKVAAYRVLTKAFAQAA